MIRDISLWHIFGYCGTLAVLLTDQISKKWARVLHEVHGDYAVNSFFNVSYTTENGALQKLFFDNGVVVEFAVMFLFFVLLMMTMELFMKQSNKINMFLFSFILGAGGSNFFDKIHLGYVPDFIYVHYSAYHFPVFNFADAVLFLCVPLMLYRMHNADDVKTFINLR